MNQIKLDRRPRVEVSLEKRTQERRNKDEAEFDKKCKTCLCMVLLCFTCFILVQAIVASIILLSYEAPPGDSLDVDYGYGYGYADLSGSNS